MANLNTENDVIITIHPARSLLELWLIVEAEFINRFEFGLCGLIEELREKQILTNPEARALMDELTKYQRARGREMWLYTWRAGHRKPRRMFIQNQILKELRNGTLQT